MLFPEWALYPIVVLATAATVIASQAVITGAYSITRQAIQLGLLPRLQVRHTSETLAGQIYMPRVNWLLLAGVLLLVLVFRSSSNLAHAYVLAVSATNLMSALLGFIVVWKIWQWRLWTSALVMVPLIAVDGIFVLASLLRIVEGAWLPVLVGVFLVLVMITWQRGTRLLMNKTRRTEVPLKSLLEALEKKPPPTVPGTAIFLTSDPEFAPTALLHNLKHNKVLHENNVILTIVTADTPRVPDSERVTITRISPRFMRITLKFGFMETPHVPKALAIARKLGFHFDIMSTSFFLSRRALKPAAHSGMPRWQDRLFIALAKSANDATDFFHIPTDRVVEVGTQVTV
jgi:KUP system potassium uptake protein